jgi:hypothetical protein
LTNADLEDKVQLLGESLIAVTDGMMARRKELDVLHNYLNGLRESMDEMMNAVTLLEQKDRVRTQREKATFYTMDVEYDPQFEDFPMPADISPQADEQEHLGIPS